VGVKRRPAARPTMRVQPIPHDGMPGRDHDLPFRVELWDDNDTHIEEVIALVSDFATAKSAFEEAVRRRPGKRIILREKARVIQKSR
jgi:hypothetical protein